MYVCAHTHGSAGVHGEGPEEGVRSSDAVIPGSERPDMGAGSELDSSGRAGGTPNC